MKCDLAGKVSLVTGAARGIGQAIAARLAVNGSTVVYTDVDETEVNAATRSPPSSSRWSRSLAGSTSSSTTPASTRWPIA
jgi:NAD(P)-dependent dehydrogenase (short-subunit alcohol dehydrogenase family)